ncbi:MAG TPA: ABC transporter permease [Candidatus Limnocylindrales bacterium]|nr:ABC transporter permease [Candidatus Limnocylindrales bacterium]
MKYFPLLWAALFRRKTRTILTLLSVVIAFVLFGLLQAVQLAFEAGADTADARRLLTISRYSFIESLPQSYRGRIEQLRDVTEAVGCDWFGGKYQNQSNAFPVIAADPARYLDMYSEFVVPPAERERAIETRTGALAGKRLVERFGWKIGQKLPISSEIYPKKDGDMNWEFDLVGTIDADDPAVRGNTDMVLINAAYFDEARATGTGTTGWYTIRVSLSADPHAVAQEIDRMFQNSPHETRTQPEKEFALGFAKQIGDIGVLVRRILAAVFFTILLLTGNTMAQSLRERIPEMAVLKTLGFSDARVTALVLAEAGLLMLLGCSIGMSFAVGIMPALNSSTGGRFPPLFVSASTWLAAIAIASVLSVAIGLPPALRARRLKIVDALAGR